MFMISQEKYYYRSKFSIQSNHWAWLSQAHGWAADKITSIVWYCEVQLTSRLKSSTRKQTVYEIEPSRKPTWPMEVVEEWITRVLLLHSCKHAMQIPKAILYAFFSISELIQWLLYYSFLRMIRSKISNDFGFIVAFRKA